MSLRYMLDTNIVSAAMRGQAHLDMRLLNAPPGSWCISSITRAEIQYGMALKPGASRLERLVGDFLALATTLAWDAEAADRYGRLRASLRQRGTPIGVFDEMIAAHALAAGLCVATDNVRHFAQIPGLEVENWLRPEAQAH